MRDNINFRAAQNFANKTFEMFGGSEFSGTFNESDVTRQFEQLLLHHPETIENNSEFIRLKQKYHNMFLPSQFATDRMVLPAGLAEPGHTDGKAEEARLWRSRRVRNRTDVINDIRKADTFIERVSMLLGVITTIANLFYACCTNEQERELFPEYIQLEEYVIPMFQRVLAIDIANNKFSFKEESFSKLAVRVLKETGKLNELSDILRNTWLIINMDFLNFLGSIPESLEAPYYDQKATFQEVCRQCLAALCHQIKVKTTQKDLLLTKFKIDADAFAASLADELGVDPSLLSTEVVGIPFIKRVGSNEIMLYVSPIYYNSFDDLSLVCEKIRKDLSLPPEDMVSYPKRETSVKGKTLNF